MNNNVKHSEKLISPFSLKYSLLKQEIENRLSNLIQLFLKDIQTLIDSVNLNHEIKKLNKKLSYQITQYETLKKENEFLIKENKYLKEQHKGKIKTKGIFIPKVDIDIKHSNCGSYSHQSHKKYKKVLEKDKQSNIGLHVKRYTLTNLNESNYYEEGNYNEVGYNKVKPIIINLDGDDNEDDDCLHNKNESLLKECCNKYDEILKDEISQLELTETIINDMLHKQNMK